MLKSVSMSRTRVIASLASISGCLVLAGALTIWSFPSRATGGGRAGVIDSIAKVDGVISGAAGGVGVNRDGDDTAAPKLEHAVPPEYPPLAKMARVQGDVALVVTVDEDGEVADVKVVSGHPLLVKAALDAVSQWRYAKPPITPLHFDVTVHFELPKETKGQSSRPAADKSAAQLPPLKLVKTVNPVYPPEAKEGRVQGNVVLSATVDKSGKVSNIEVVSGPQELNKPAINAVKQWEYEPLVEAPVLTTVIVNFNLAEDPAVTFQTEVRGLLEDQDESKDVIHWPVRKPPMPIYNPEPTCPPEAGKVCRQGTMSVWITVDPEGKVTETEVSKSLGPIVDKAALDTVRTWRFRPATEDGKPVSDRVMVEFTFHSLTYR